MRRRDGHATDARRPGQRRLRRGLEPHAPGARAENPAQLRGGGRGLSDHQHLWRQPVDAQSARSCGSFARDQPGRRPPGAGGVWRPQGFVLGDLGPLGAILEPYGDLPDRQARRPLTRNRRAALVEAGVDAIIIETQTSLEEMGVAIDAAKAAGAPCIIASFAYDLSRTRLFM